MVRSVRHSFSRRVVGVIASLLVLASVVGGVGTSPAESQTPGRLFDLFDADAPSDDWQNTYLLSLLSHYVYDPNVPQGSGETFADRFEDAFSAHGLQNFTYIEGLGGFITGTQGMIVETDDAVIVVMRGTEVLSQDILTDLNVKVDLTGTHTGFRTASASVLLQVSDRLANSRGKKVWFTGHSLGGAVTQDLAFFLRDSVDVAGVVTFGEPQMYTLNPLNPFEVSDTYIAHPIFNKTELWLNDRDVVPHAVSVASPLVGYGRVGDEHHIRVASSLSCSVQPSFPSWYWAPWLSDHDTARYSTRLYSLMPEQDRAALAAMGHQLSGGLQNPPLQPDPVADCDFVDTTPPPDPTVTANVSGALGNNGWYRSDVTVTWSAEDIPAGTPSQNCQTSTVRIDTTGRTIVCRYFLSGGETVEGRVTIKRDATPPETSLQMARSANSYGWYTSPVAYSTVGSDAMSGIASCSTERRYSGPDRSSKLLSGVCFDAAGNRDAGYVRIKYDATAPTIKIVTPPNGANYVYGQTIVADYSCSDSTAGISSCSGTVADGKAIVLKSTGKKSFSVTARDAAGNTRSASVSYTVSYK